MVIGGSHGGLICDTCQCQNDGQSNQSQCLLFTEVEHKFQHIATFLTSKETEV